MESVQPVEVPFPLLLGAAILGDGVSRPTSGGDIHQEMAAHPGAEVTPEGEE